MRKPAVVVLFVVTACSLAAAPIEDLFSTGYAANGLTDANWVVNGSPAFVTDQTQYPFPYWSATSEPRWISPQSGYGSASDDRDTTFVFSTKFTIPDPFLSAVIAMRVATDNGLLDVKLNGSSVALPKSLIVLPGNSVETSVIPQGTGFSSGLGPQLSIDSGFRLGENTLELYVRNSVTDDANNGNPMGLLAAVSGEFVERGDVVAPIPSPEPATFAFIGTGLSLLVAGARRRRS